MPFPAVPSASGKYPFARDADGERIDVAAYSPGDADDVDAPAVNTAAVVTYVADADTIHVLTQMTFSYSAAPDAGSYVQVAVAGDVVFRAYITQGGPGPIEFVPPICTERNQAMVLTLSAGGGGISGQISGRHYTVMAQ